jgi:hypothetical protein
MVKSVRCSVVLTCFLTWVCLSMEKSYTIKQYTYLCNMKKGEENHRNLKLSKHNSSLLLKGGLMSFFYRSQIFACPVYMWSSFSRIFKLIIYSLSFNNNYQSKKRIVHAFWNTFSCTWKYIVHNKCFCITWKNHIPIN